MRKVWCVIVALAIGGLVTSALAQQEKKQRRGKPEKVSGTFVSASVEGGQVELKIDTDDGEKTYEMSASVVALCREKKGQKMARMVRVSRAGKTPKAKGKTEVVQGDIQSAALQGTKVVMTIKPADGDATQVALTSQLTVVCRQGKALAIISTGRARGQKPEGAGRQRRKKKGADAPENF